MSADLLICVAVELECERIRARLRDGRIGELEVGLLVTGVGPVRAAHAATLHLARHGAGRLVNCGVAGAYPGSGLELLDVACAQSDTYGAGSYAPADRYQYSAGFYQRASGVIEPYVRDRVDAFYHWLVEKSEGAFELVRKIYTGNVNTYALYILLFLGLILLAGLGWGL